MNTTEAIAAIRDHIANGTDIDDVTPAVLHRGRGPNRGDLLTADIHTPEGMIRLHAWANTQHTLTRLFAAGNDPNRTIQMTVTGRAATRIADTIAEHHRKGTI